MLCSPTMTEASHIPIPDSSVPGIIWPAIPKLNSNILLTLLFQLEQSQWWPPERLRAAQFRQASHLLRHAFESVTYYQKRLGEVGFNPDTALDEEIWLRLPLLKREDIQQAEKNCGAGRCPKHTARPPTLLRPVPLVRR